MGSPVLGLAGHNTLLGGHLHLIHKKFLGGKSCDGSVKVLADPIRSSSGMFDHLFRSFKQCANSVVIAKPAMSCGGKGIFSR